MDTLISENSLYLLNVLNGLQMHTLRNNLWLFRIFFPLIGNYERLMSGHGAHLRL